MNISAIWYQGELKNIGCYMFEKTRIIETGFLIEKSKIQNNVNSE